MNRSRVRPFAIPVVGIIALLGGLAARSGRAAAQADGAAAPRRLIVVEAFVRAGSRQCEQLRHFLADLQRRRPGLRVIVRDVAESPSDLDRLKTLARRFGVEPRIPTVYAGQQLIVGFRDAASTGRQIEDTLRVLVFTREGCPRCAQAMPYVRGLPGRYPGLSVEIFEVTRDINARAWCERLTRQAGIRAPGFPTFHLFGRTIVGYSGLETTGAQIETMLQAASAPAGAMQGAAPATRGPSSVPDRSGFLRAPGMLILTAFQLPPPRDEGGLPPEADLPPEAEEPVVHNVPGAIPGAERGPPPETIRVPVLGRLEVRDLGMPLFTFLIGLVDGFNPCAMWVLVFLLSVLAGLRDRRKIVLIAGTFVVVSGLVYYAFMTAWLNVFLLIGFARPAQVILGLMGVFIGAVNIKDFFAFRRGLSLSIPESAKPGIYSLVHAVAAARRLTAALAGAIVLALLVNTVELLCTAGLPALYTQILTYRNYPLWVNYLYLGLYIVAYMLDDAVVLTIVVVTLSRGRLQEREGRWLKLVSGLVILGLGLVMLVKPGWLI
jgi:hypothetical protein